MPDLRPTILKNDHSGSMSEKDSSNTNELPPSVKTETVGQIYATSESKQSPKDLEAALTFLKKKDDTSRFVGLALLKPVLEQRLNHETSLGEEQRFDPIQRSWGAVPLGFLDRLLKARPSDKRSKDEAQNMVGLAVAILHVFLTLLDSPHTDQKFMERIPFLKAALRFCSQETRTQIMSILHTIVMTNAGSIVIFKDAKTAKPDQKPESYLFITMLLIDIRSSVSSLHESLHSSSYPATSERLIKSYDIISAFIGFLIQTLEQSSHADQTTFSSPLPIDLLLKIRTNISETLSLTIEHLRDRYDSSIGGAAGLHPSARAPTNPPSSTPLSIAWDNSTGIFTDPLTLSQLRTLSLWLRDEENDALRMEAAGIVDVFLALYQHKGEQAFRSPVLVALEGVIEASEGVDDFLREECWPILADDLTEILPNPSSHALGIEIVRVLLTVTESDTTGAPQEEWMSILTLATTSLSSVQKPSLELPIAVAQLAVELLARAPRGMRERYSQQRQDLLRVVTMLNIDDSLKTDEGIRDGLEEVVDGLIDLDLMKINKP